MKKVIALCGSQSARSANLQLIHEMQTLARDKFELILFNKLDQLPHFNPDLETENPPAAVSEFRNELRNADGVLICTPEYAMGVPGTLKNALDWLVSSMELSHKPVALVTASTSGEKAHHAVLATLKVIEADVDDDTSLLIPFIKTKLDQSGSIKDDNLRADIIGILTALSEKTDHGK